MAQWRAVRRTRTFAASHCGVAASRKRSGTRLTNCCRRSAFRMQPAPIDLARTFDRDAPTVLEIGCGMGETTVAIAQARPDINFLGVEVFTAGVGALLKGIGERGLTNVRIVHHDAVEVVRDMIALELAGGRPCLLSRSVAEETPPQATVVAAGVCGDACGPA